MPAWVSWLSSQLTACHAHTNLLGCAWDVNDCDTVAERRVCADTFQGRVDLWPGRKAAGMRVKAAPRLGQQQELIDRPMSCKPLECHLSVLLLPPQTGVPCSHASCTIAAH